MRRAESADQNRKHAQSRDVAELGLVRDRRPQIDEDNPQCEDDDGEFEADGGKVHFWICATIVSDGSRSGKDFLMLSVNKAREAAENNQAGKKQGVGHFAPETFRIRDVGPLRGRRARRCGLRAAYKRRR